MIHCENCGRETEGMRAWIIKTPGNLGLLFCSPPCIHEWLSEHYGEQPLKPRETP